MISYPIYKIVHLIGIFMIMISLGGLVIHAINDGSKAGNRFRKAIGITHGIGLVLVLVAGFGLLARLGIHWPWPGWVLVKVVIWVVLGAFSALPYRMGTSGQGLWYALIVLGGLAAYMAILKPF